jgi:hypothetical protein
VTPLEELRSIGSFSGAMFKVLEDFNARLEAVEAHMPMLEVLKPHFEEQQRAIKERAEQEASREREPDLPASPVPIVAAARNIDEEGKR